MHSEKSQWSYDLGSSRVSVLGMFVIFKVHCISFSNVAACWQFYQCGLLNPIIISYALKNEKEGNWNKTRTYIEYKHLPFVTVPMIFNVFFNALLWKAYFLNKLFTLCTMFNLLYVLFNPISLGKIKTEKFKYSN